MRTLDLLPLLKSKGVRVDFCTLGKGEGELDDIVYSHGCKIFSCPLSNNIFAFRRRFLNLLRTQYFDIVHSHVYHFSGYILRLAEIAGVQARIMHFRNIRDGKTLTWKRRVYVRLMRYWENKYATSVLAVCEGAMIHSWGEGWRRDPRCQVIYNGIDMAKFENQKPQAEYLRQELGIPENSILFINIARFDALKGHRTIVEAAEKALAVCGDFYFIFVGDGNLRGSIENLVEQKGIQGHFRFLGIRRDVSRLLKSSDCFVLASEWEGLPGVVIEAIAAGKPVISTNLPGVREIATHTPLIETVPVGDSKKLSEKMAGISNRIEACQYDSARLSKIFTADWCAKEILSVYVNAVTQSK